MNTINKDCCYILTLTTTYVNNLNSQIEKLNSILSRNRTMFNLSNDINELESEISNIVNFIRPLEFQLHSNEHAYTSVSLKERFKILSANHKIKKRLTNLYIAHDKKQEELAEKQKELDKLPKIDIDEFSSIAKDYNENISHLYTLTGKRFGFINPNLMEENPSCLEKFDINKLVSPSIINAAKSEDVGEMN